MKIISSILAAGLMGLICGSCKKSWLDAKPVQSLVVPHTLQDYKSLISGTTHGGSFNIEYGGLSEHGSGDFYVLLNNGSPIENNFYSWTPDIWSGTVNYSPWLTPYKKILYTNIVLGGIESISPKNNAEQNDWYQTKGAALFLRACLHYDVASQFCKPYNKNTAATDLGIPLRLNDDFNEPSVRSTVEQTYSQIINDLKNSASILPVDKPIDNNYKVMPTKAAAYAMLARVYLSMANYDSAFLYSDRTLQLYSTLMNYNSYTTFSKFGPEVIFYMVAPTYVYFGTSKLLVDSNLLKSYNANDLRKTLFFKPQPASTTNPILRTIKVTYDGTTSLFAGPATDEMYLIRAECYARKNQKDQALNDLNTLMINRWSNNGSWTPFNATDANDALTKILTERRKELCFRNLRWTDIKRLNTEPQFATTLTKLLNGQLVNLAPNSPLYVFPIPPNVIQLTGMQQNPR